MFFNMFFYLLTVLRGQAGACLGFPYMAPVWPTRVSSIAHTCLSETADPNGQPLIPSKRTLQYVYSVIGKHPNQASSHLKHDIEAPLLPIEPVALPRRR